MLLLRPLDPSFPIDSATVRDREESRARAPDISSGIALRRDRCLYAKRACNFPTTAVF
jgi:hypothetical protein